MTVYVDNLIPCIRSRRWPWPKACHLWPQHANAQSLETLHAFAASIGLRRSWFQPHHLPHYDLTQAKRQQALATGATPLTDRAEIHQLIERLRNELIEASALERQHPDLYNQAARDLDVPF